jgi:hypothetical protein
MICRRCGGRVNFTGPPVAYAAGIGLGAPAVHAATGLELGADGHVAAPFNAAPVREAV